MAVGFVFMYSVYIMYSEKINKCYIGYSSDIEERLRKHNNASKGFTNAGRPWRLVYTEHYVCLWRAHRQPAAQFISANWQIRNLSPLLSTAFSHLSFIIIY
ncbi:MAG: GIY-YIG nuclease family protein [Bacteroidales bacterium]|jgi:putative endonuclease|nr:GIY-YIG nuclease family protein [Bacteroidales bacterium]